MSGPDVIVGLVFGALPLIVKAVEGYEKINDVIATYRRYSNEAARFSTELSTQKAIFHNECKLLLREVVDDQRLLHEIHEMFSHPVNDGDPKHDIRQRLKNDENLDRKLSERINARTDNSYTELVELLRIINQDLLQIYEETKYYISSRPSVSALLSLSAPMLKTDFPSHRGTPTRSENGYTAFVRNFASRLRKRHSKTRFAA